MKLIVHVIGDNWILIETFVSYESEDISIFIENYKKSDKKYWQFIIHKEDTKDCNYCK